MSQATDYRMPAEWEPHLATWIAWPHRQSDWPGKFRPIPWVYCEIVRQLTQCERVRIEVVDATQEADARKKLQRAGVDLTRVDFYTIPTNRCWTRDHGPIFVTNSAGQKAITDWHFNAWAKYPDWQLDDAVPATIAAHHQLPAWQPTFQGRRVVLEGGSIEVNGAGVLMTTEECLLSEVQQRNPGMTREDLEATFATYLGIRQVIWLDRGVVGDDTHGHIDDLARFVNPTTIVTVLEDSISDENFEPLHENLERLKAARRIDGGRYEIITLPMPDPVVFDGQRLPASYANFYIANDRVIVPTFNDRKDRLALGQLAELFPDRDVVGIHCGDLVWGLGTLHCMTQQEPLGAGESLGFAAG
ncbi:agmatine deiminase family protein [Tuwongella immobilis]|uniref:Agmatine deiminase n=1 Tax=Tuwongella immobilis TaxID=692036 RepID=A0A6C2YNK4_9BACT|nr:agmatine deiminase family protein [Tuwongella immobilis]VIP02871.1 agmatine deiminase : Peptidyl-arginine deiminase family protein OS=Acidobacterium capsulatum (strain ATCC 51196 / DSM 11244 / JCM 7670) GN=ACP_1746 PE=4 SV=1: PAD_porph [Tuwongella immobilis]VTS02701.1 agmatine deiminase : Peptidyl-arginine deiminase family protein OS=Acidobacterium capsulatum (strain ATCC 51196 / DSM 11244 / JCM 7670) GN=ACP_1746 PE=4 SV=1: PAD_porph [Tuwongella immobilis]